MYRPLLECLFCNIQGYVWPLLQYIGLHSLAICRATFSTLLHYIRLYVQASFRMSLLQYIGLRIASFAIYRVTLVGNIQGYIQYSLGLSVQASFRMSLLHNIGLHSSAIYMATHSTLLQYIGLHVQASSEISLLQYIGLHSLALYVASYSTLQGSMCRHLLEYLFFNIQVYTPWQYTGVFFIFQMGVFFIFLAISTLPPLSWRRYFSWPKKQRPPYKQPCMSA